MNLISKEAWEFFTTEAWFVKVPNTSILRYYIHLHGNHVWVSDLAAEELLSVETHTWLNGIGIDGLSNSDILNWHSCNPSFKIKERE